MSSILLFLLFGFIVMIFAETSSEIDRLKERLQNLAKQHSITELFNIPKPATYLNSKLTQNVPHQIDLTNELTSIIPEWNPRILAFDPTCPYYFSTMNNLSSSEDNLNLLSYIQAIESNETVTFPFINILPQSYRSSLPLPSIFHCHELISNPFFHNIELILGPGKTELSLYQQSKKFSQFYCSLYGSPQFLLINQTKQFNDIPTTLLFQDNLDTIDFILTSLTPGTCLFIPSNWIIGVQLNNSISLLFTLKTITNNDEFLQCTKINKLITLDNIQFEIDDQFNITTMNLLIYFYQYLNPPIFDRKYTSETFYSYFQQDKNISQLIMKWTSELIDLIQNKLFQQIDINHDDIFNIQDYIDIKQLNMKEIEESISEILEEIRRTIFQEYKQLSETMKNITRQSTIDGLDNEDKQTLITMIENLPESVKQNLKRNNIYINDVLNKIKNAKSKPSSNKKSDL